MSNQQWVQEVLGLLLKAQPTRVSYDQIELTMQQVGLDPFTDGEAYEHIITQLESNHVLIVEDLKSTSTEEILQDVSTISVEIKEVLDTVLGELERDQYRLLTAEEERYLLEIRHAGLEAEKELANADSEAYRHDLKKRIRDGQLAEEELIKRNKRLVIKWAQKFGSHAQYLDIKDIIQEGLIGLLKGIQKFDLNTNRRLSTYATFWIRQSILRAIADHDRIIRYPVHINEAISQYTRVESILYVTLQRKPTDIEIAIELGFIDDVCIKELSDYCKPLRKKAIQKVQQLRALKEKHILSLDNPIGNKDNSVLEDFIEDNDFQTPLDIIIERTLQDTIQGILAKLTPRERLIIEHRFGLNGKQRMTLQELGDKLGVTRERVRQIEANAMNKLNHPQSVERLSDFRYSKGEKNNELNHSAKM